jgi:uncharacterized protein involved in exopolysaccharide biosynthesis
MTNAELRKLQQRAAVLTARYEALLKMEQTPMIQDISEDTIHAVNSPNWKRLLPLFVLD